MSNMREIVELYKNEEFKREFIANYTKIGESKYIAENEYVAAFRLIHKNESNGIPHVAPLYCATTDSVKRALLMISEQGLMFDPRKKEVAIFTGIQSNNKVFLDFTLRYRGMYRLVGSSSKVKSTSIEIVYEGDTFEWRGSKVEPIYLMNIHHNRNVITAGFCSFTMHDGSVIAHMMSNDELYAIIHLHVKAELESKVDSEMWTGAWLGKSLRAKVFREAFSIHKVALLSGNAMLDANQFEDSKNPIDEFAKELEIALAEEEADHETND